MSMWLFNSTRFPEFKSCKDSPHRSKNLLRVFLPVFHTAKLKIMQRKRKQQFHNDFKTYYKIPTISHSRFHTNLHIFGLFGILNFHFEHGKNITKRSANNKINIDQNLVEYRFIIAAGFEQF